MSGWHLMGSHWADTWRVSTELTPDGYPLSYQQYLSQVSTDLSGWPWLVSTELQCPSVWWRITSKAEIKKVKFAAVGAYKISNTSRLQLITLEAMLSTKWPLHLLPYTVKHSEINRDSSHTAVALYTWHFFTPLHQLVYTGEYSNFTIYMVS